ncbi:hypothetical protein KCP74_06135 [Salmonella enterica subsp. enterica]|nr:hypothetical protein KCP74_06135 [Salmonella enterica subsp. enterica]
MQALIERWMRKPNVIQRLVGTAALMPPYKYYARKSVTSGGFDRHLKRYGKNALRPSAAGSAAGPTVINVAVWRWRAAAPRISGFLHRAAGEIAYGEDGLRRQSRQHRQRLATPFPNFRITSACGNGDGLAFWHRSAQPR